MVFREAVDIILHCHLESIPNLSSVPRQGLLFSDIVDQIETSDSYLPQSSIALLQALNDQSHILLLENHTDENQS